MLKYLLAVAVAVLLASAGCRSARQDTRAEAHTVLGFTMGMTQGQVKGQLPWRWWFKEENEFKCRGDECIATNLPHGFEYADWYVFLFGENGEGLYQIGVVFDCEGDGYGYKTRSIYGRIKADLSGVFGEPHQEEYIADSPPLPIFSDYIESGERKLLARWGQQGELGKALLKIWESPLLESPLADRSMESPLLESPLADRNLAGVSLYAYPSDGKVMVGIMFWFENWKAVEVAKRKARFGQ